MDPYEGLREQLPKEVTFLKLQELMQVSSVTLWHRMRFRQTPSHLAKDNKPKFVNVDDAIDLLRFYKALG